MRKWNVLLALLVAVGMVVVSVGSYFYYQRKKSNENSLNRGNYYKQIPDSKPKEATPPANETANWKTYTSTRFAISFKYPPEWSLEETLSGVSILVGPDLRMVVGACPDYVFVVSNRLDPKENLSAFLPIRQGVLDKKPVEVFEKTNKYGCLTVRIFVNKFPREDYSPSLVITLGGKNPRDKLDQIISTFKFLDKTKNDFSACNHERFGYGIGEYYECQGFNILYPKNNIMDAPVTITDKNWKEITQCGGMPGPNGNNSCPGKYIPTNECKKTTCPIKN